MTTELRPAGEVSIGDLATLFAGAFEDYLVPFEMDESRLGHMVDAYDLDLTRSQVALDDGRPVGFGLLGVRSERAWVGGTGVLPGDRRRGHGESLTRALLDQARRAGAREIALEAILDNTPAIALYEKLGFERTRELEVLALAQERGSASAENASTGDALQRIAAQRDAPEPWQREEATLANLERRSPATRALVAAAGTAVFRDESGSINLMQAAGEPAALKELVAAMRSVGKVRALNFPAGGGVSAALRGAGAELVTRQYEMLASL